MTSTTSTIYYPNETSRLSLARLRWIPFVILLTVVIILTLLWEQIPEMWIVHWNLRGEADGWVSKTIIGAMMPVFLGIPICAFLEVMAVWIGSIRSFAEGYKGKPEAAAVMSAATAGMLRLVNIAMALILAIIAVKLPLYPSSGPAFVVAFTFSAVVIAIMIGLRRIIAANRALKRAGLMEGMEGFDGLVYRNPNDPRLWVPKPLGYGYTINFAHRRAWPVFIAILAIPLSVVLIIIVLVSR